MMFDMMGRVISVDYLNRLMIPSTYKDKLSIKADDKLVVELHDSSLVITKLDKLDSMFDNYAKMMCDAIHLSIAYDIAFVSTTRVVAYTGCEVDLSKRPISKKLSKCFESPDITCDIQDEDITYLTDEAMKEVELACPIRYCNKVIGAIVVIKDPKLPKINDSLIKVVESHARLFTYLLIS